MDEILSVALSSLHQDMNRLDHAAFNLTNAATPGYKREVVAVRPFLAEMESAASTARAESAAQPGPTLMPWQIALDMHAGSLTQTGGPLDLALTGDGFFEIQTDDGPRYTRQGSFHVDARGRLVTAQGHPVAGKGGDIVLSGRKPQIDEYGKITEPDSTQGTRRGLPNEPTAQIKVVRFEDTSRMRHLGDGLMTAGETPTSPLAGPGQVRQGALENSNVSNAQEMIEIIQTMRHFESMQKVSQGYHELLGTAIHKLGDLS